MTIIPEESPMPPTALYNATWLRPEARGRLLTSGPELRDILGDHVIQNATSRDPHFPDPVASAGSHRGSRKYYLLDEIIEWIENSLFKDARSGGTQAMRQAIDQSIANSMVQSVQEMNDQLRRARQIKRGYQPAAVRRTLNQSILDDLTAAREHMTEAKPALSEVEQRLAEANELLRQAQEILDQIPNGGTD